MFEKQQNCWCKAITASIFKSPPLTPPTPPPSLFKVFNSAFWAPGFHSTTDHPLVDRYYAVPNTILLDHLEHVMSNTMVHRGCKFILCYVFFFLFFLLLDLYKKKKKKSNNAQPLFKGKRTMQCFKSILGEYFKYVEGERKKKKKRNKTLRLYIQRITNHTAKVF